MDTGDILGVISTLLALIAIPITFLVGRRARQFPDLRFCIDFDVLLKPDEKLLDQGLTMTIGDNPIDSISRTRIAFWNHRGDTVNREDIVATDLLRIAFPEGGTPLQVRTLSTSREQIGFKTFIDRRSKELVDFEFDFIDAGDGAVFEVVQAGTAKPEVCGTIKGAKPLRSIKPVKLSPGELEKMSAEWWRSDRIRRNMGLMALFGLLSLFLFFTVLSAIRPGAIQGGLVNYKNYNLQTVQGQESFSTAVQDEPQPLGRPIALGGVAFFTAALAAVTLVLYQRLHQRIPRTIVTHRYRTPSASKVDTSSKSPAET